MWEYSLLGLVHLNGLRRARLSEDNICWVLLGCFKESHLGADAGEDDLIVNILFHVPQNVSNIYIYILLAKSDNIIQTKQSPLIAQNHHPIAQCFDHFNSGPPPH